MNSLLTCANYLLILAPYVVDIAFRNMLSLDQITAVNVEVCIKDLPGQYSFGMDTVKSFHQVAQLGIEYWTPFFSPHNHPFAGQRQYASDFQQRSAIFIEVGPTT